MARSRADAMLAVHLHRALDGSWYAVGTFRDKSIGKYGQKILEGSIASSTIDMIAGLIETEKHFRPEPVEISAQSLDETSPDSGID